MNLVKSGRDFFRVLTLTSHFGLNRFIPSVSTTKSHLWRQFLTAVWTFGFPYPLAAIGAKLIGIYGCLGVDKPQGRNNSQQNDPQVNQSSCNFGILQNIRAKETKHFRSTWSLTSKGPNHILWSIYEHKFIWQRVQFNLLNIFYTKQVKYGHYKQITELIKSTKNCHSNST